MIKNELSGYYVDGGLIRYISNLIEPTNIEIVMILELFRNKKTGKLKLENLAAKNEIEPLDLTLYFEDGNYLLMLLDFDEEGYIDIRTPYNPSASHGTMQNIFGEPYGATTIVQDFEIVKKCFMEFSQKGNISNEILS